MLCSACMCISYPGSVAYLSSLLACRCITLAGSSATVALYWMQRRHTWSVELIKLNS